MRNRQADIIQLAANVGWLNISRGYPLLSVRIVKFRTHCPVREIKRSVCVRKSRILYTIIYIIINLLTGTGFGCFKLWFMRGRWTCLLAFF